MPSDADIAELVRRWHERSKGGRALLNDPYDKFICLWIAFNAWGASKTHQDRDLMMIRRLQRDSELRSSFERCKEDPDFSRTLSEIEGDRVIDDRTGESASMDDQNSFESVLWVIYRIRCNLFHGRKNPTKRRDLRLVNWAHFILDRVFDQIVRNLV